VAYQDPTTGARAELGLAITHGFDHLAEIVNESEDDAIAMKPFVECICLGVSRFEGARS
jgi:hypothetical protein